MDIDLEILLCGIASTLTTGSFIPQTIKIVKTRETKGISFLMYLIFTIGLVFWIAAGIAMSNYPIIIANIITFILAGTILTVKTANILQKKN